MTTSHSGHHLPPPPQLQYLSLCIAICVRACCACARAWFGSARPCFTCVRACFVCERVSFRFWRAWFRCARVCAHVVCMCECVLTPAQGRESRVALVQPQELQVHARMRHHVRSRHALGAAQQKMRTFAHCTKFISVPATKLRALAQQFFCPHLPAWHS